MSNRDPDVAARIGLERRPYAETFVYSFEDCAEWLEATHGGPRMQLSAHARRVIWSYRDLHHDQAKLARVLEAEGPRFAVAHLLWHIASYNHRLREAGRTALELPTEARDVLLQFIHGEPVDLATARRAVEAAQELHRYLGWKVLAKIGDRWVAVPGAFPD